MTKILSFLLFFCILSAFGQTVEVEYKYHKLLYKDDLSRDEIHKLINIDNEVSYYVVDKAQDNSNIPGYIGPTESEPLRSYKKFNQDSIYTVYPFGFAYGYVKEKIPVIDWKIEKEHKKILDYDCIKATAEFRGRKYEAYYTEKIATTDGPWKFSGLPGTILEIYDTDKKVTFEAVAVRIKKEKNNYDHYLANLKIKKKHTFDGFSRISVKSHYKILAALNASLSNNSEAISSADLIKDYPQEIEIIDVEKYK